MKFICCVDYVNQEGVGRVLQSKLTTRAKAIALKKSYEFFGHKAWVEKATDIDLGPSGKWNAMEETK